MPSRLASSVVFGAAFSFGVAVAAITCDSPTIVPGLGGGASGSFCDYPRGCYVIPQNATECDDCTGGPDHCRLYFVPTPGMPNPLDLGGFFVPSGSDLGGTGWMLPSSGPLITDQPVLCTLYNQVSTVPADKQVICSSPESLCVARGPQCGISSFCVRAGKTCMSDTPFTPQHKPGMSGTDTFCPYTDDVCCPGPMPDASLPGDAGPADLGDAGPPADAAPTDATPSG